MWLLSNTIFPWDASLLCLAVATLASSYVNNYNFQKEKIAEKRRKEEIFLVQSFYTDQWKGKCSKGFISVKLNWTKTFSIGLSSFFLKNSKATFENLTHCWPWFKLKKKWSPIWSVKIIFVAKEIWESIWLISRERSVNWFLKLDFKAHGVRESL